MSSIPRWKTLYERRKTDGKCPTCGGNKDRDGYYCTNCLEKHRKYVNETRAFLREIGICPQCQKNSVIGEQKICLECLADNATKKKKQVLTEEQKKIRNAKVREKYKERSEKGLCTLCGKVKADYGKKKCKKCLYKDAEFHRLKRII